MVTSSFSARLVAEPFLEGTAEKPRHHLSCQAIILKYLKIIPVVERNRKMTTV